MEGYRAEAKIKREKEPLSISVDPIIHVTEPQMRTAMDL